MAGQCAEIAALFFQLPPGKQDLFFGAGTKALSLRGRLHPDFYGRARAHWEKQILDSHRLLSLYSWALTGVWGYGVLRALALSLQHLKGVKADRPVCL